MKTEKYNVVSSDKVVLLLELYKMLSQIHLKRYYNT